MGSQHFFKNFLSRMVDSFFKGVVPGMLINKGQKNFSIKKRRKINTFVLISTLKLIKGP